MRTLVALLLPCAMGAIGCATGTKAKILEQGYEDAERRRELFEANLRVLDRNPEYVDEFFALARHHPATLERFVVNQSKALEHDAGLAALTAKHLRAHPKALENTMVHTLEAVEHHERARRAVAEAMKDRAGIAAGIILEEPAALSALGKAMVTQAKDDPQKRDGLKEAFKEAVKGDAKEEKR